MDKPINPEASGLRVQMTTLDPGNAEKTLVINRIFELLVLLMNSMQGMQAAVSKRMEIMSQWGQLATDQLTQLQTVNANTAAASNKALWTDHQLPADSKLKLLPPDTPFIQKDGKWVVAGPLIQQKDGSWIVDRTNLPPSSTAFDVGKTFVLPWEFSESSVSASAPVPVLQDKNGAWVLNISDRGQLTLMGGEALWSDKSGGSRSLASLGDAGNTNSANLRNEMNTHNTALIQKIKGMQSIPENEQKILQTQLSNLSTSCNGLQDVLKALIDTLRGVTTSAFR